MSSELIEQTQKALLPDGSLWQIKFEDDFDKLLNGMAENWETVRAFAQTAGEVRDPFKTSLLQELEEEHGITTDFDLTDDERRTQLAAVKFDNTDNQASDDDLQTFLVKAGFNVQVHRNDPPVDPALFPGELILNGNILLSAPGFGMQCSTFSGLPENISFCGFHANETGPPIFLSVCGFFRNATRIEVVPELPTDPDSFGFIFFVGGDATRDGSGALTSILPADVPLHRQDKFKNFILQTKPWETWAVLIIDFIP